MKKIFGRIAILALVVSLLGSVSVFADDSEAFEIAYDGEEYFYESFDTLTPTEEYVKVAGSSEYAAHFMSTEVKVTEDEAICIDGDEPSIVIKGNSDIRWWLLSMYGINAVPSDYLVFEFYINIKNISRDLRVSITDIETMDKTLPNTTSNESDAGKFMFIVPSETTEGAYDIKNRDEQVITTITGNEDHKISVAFSGETSDYYFFVDDTYCANSKSQWVSPVTQIECFRFDMSSKSSEPNEVVIDSIMMDSCSLVEPGSAPTDEEEPATDAPETGNDEEETEAPATDAPATDAPATDAPADDKTDAADEKSGCGSVIGGSAAMVALLGLAVVAMKKKH